MRKPINTYGTLLLIIGSLLKILFVSMFSSTVLAVVASTLGVGNVALPIYLAIWNVFWRTCLTLIGAIAIITMLDSLQ
ncbi:MAG: hypothetical protein AAFW75_09980 [Cyanobacteria bacterium J06636_16]